MRLRSFSLFFVLAILAGAMLFGQEFRASIGGRINDESGAGIPGAKVTATNTATNEAFNTETTSDGVYTIPLLKPGVYSIAVEASGFKKAVRDNIEARVGDKVTVDFAMTLGAVTESVTVVGEAPLLQAEDSSRGQVIDNLRVTELPLNGRNPINFMNLTPGVVYAGNLQFIRPFDNGDNINFSINGGLKQANNYLLDGIADDAITDTSSDRSHANLNIAYIPTVDAMQEFKVATNFYDAQYGRTAGGVINMMTKGGTNQFHGTVYEFMRRYQLDANSISSNASNKPRYSVDPVTKKNLGGHKLDQYGTQITGPVYIPKLYNGKDKTFFSFGVENYKESTPSPSLTHVPSLAERQGDFSGVGVNIYDPLSTVVNPNFDPTKPNTISNPQYIRTQFPGNVIPQNRWNAVGSNILNSYPTPNTGASGAAFNNFIASPNLSSDHFRNWIARVDQNIGQRERLFFRYAHNRRDQFDNGANGYSGPGQDAQDPLVRLNDNAVVDSTTVLSPTTVLDVRLGYTRFIQAAYRTAVTGFDITKLGFPAAFADARFNNQPPRIEVDQYPTWGARNPSQNTTNLLTFAPSVSFIRGRHSMKAGMEIRNFRPNAKGGSFIWGAGDFAFGSGFTQQYPAFSNGSGNAVAALLLGFPNNYSASGNTSSDIVYTPQLAFQWNYYGFYFQDDIRLSSRLTVNVGLRYDIEGSPAERYNRMNRGFALDQASPLAASVQNANAADCPACANLKGGLLFAGVNGVSSKAFETDWNNIQPRIGASYRVGERTVIRGGYAIFYLPVADYGGSNGFSATTPFVATSGGGINDYIPTGTLSNPFPNGLNQPTGSSLGLSTGLGTGIIFNNPDRKIPYVHSFSAGIQHQFPWNVVMTGEYVGSRTKSLNTNINQGGGARNLNVNTVAQLNQASQNATYFTQAVSNPFATLIPGTSLNGSTIARQQLLLPYPQYTSVLEGLEPVGKMWYDSLQVTLEKRYSAGLTLVGAYTWSKNLVAVQFMNNQDLRPTKALAPDDRPQRFVLSAVYQLPFGRGRHFGTKMNRALDLAVGGWEVNTIGTFQSGTPMNLPGAYNILGDPSIGNQGYGRWFNTCMVQLDGTVRQPNAAHSGWESCSNPVWSQRNTSYTLQTTPFRSPKIRNPWASQMDLSISKTFNVTERVKGQFRAEAFNVSNTPIRTSPNTDPTSTQFGLVSTNQSNYPRQVQFGFKVNF